jgi:hypothetical protein
MLCWIILLIALLPSAPRVLITEVMANAVNEDTGEFIEILNVGDSSINLTGWTFTDGDAMDVIIPFDGDELILKPGQFGVILDSEYAGEYKIPPETLLLTTKNTTLGDGLSTKDPITLFDDKGETVDTFSHPFNPGNGISIERVSLEVGDTKLNWKACLDPSGSTPGRPNSVWSVRPPSEKPKPKPSRDVIINELMYAPDTKMGHPEWIELYNRSTEPIELTGYRIVDSSGRECKLPENTFIRPLSYLVLTRKLSSFKGWFPGVEAVEVKLPSLNNSGDTVSLLGPSGELIERMSYRGGGERDRSLERIDPKRSADDPGNWHASLDKKGSTPGARNSVTGLPKGSKITLAVEPKVFNPDRTRLRIYYEAPMDSEITLYIFNSAGRLIVTLIERERIGGRQRVEWDGRDKTGREMPTGLYLCQLIAEFEDDKAAATAVIPVIISRK